MKALVATLPRRLGWSVLAFALAAAFGLWLLQAATAGGVIVSDGQLLTHLLLGPMVCAVVVILMTSLFARPPAQVAAAPVSAAPVHAVPAPVAAKPFMAQVVGLQWLNPLQRKDYPTQWQLLWTLGLVKPNANDELVAEDRERYSKVQPLAPVVSADGTSLEDFLFRYLDKLLSQLHDAYFADPRAFYNACEPQERLRRTLANIYIVCALPAGLDDEKVVKGIANRIAATFDLGEKRPNVRVVPGDAEVGKAALSFAFDYLRMYPEQSVWLLGWDAPSHPADGQLNENLVWMVLAGPECATGREPLAWIGHPASADMQDFEPSKDAPRAVQAWKAAFERALANVDKHELAPGYVVHDAGPSSERIGSLAQTLSTECIDFDMSRQAFNAGTFFEDAGACSSLTWLTLAIGHTKHFGPAALVAFTGEKKVAALAAVSPAGTSSLQPGNPWFRASSEAHSYLPWWGRLLDKGTATIETQGFSA